MNKSGFYLTQVRETGVLCTAVPQHVKGIGSRTPPASNAKIQGCSSPLRKMARYLHLTCACPPAYFKSSLDDL